MIGHATSTILGLDLRTIEIWTDIALRYFSCKSRHCVRIEYFWKPRSNPETVYDVDIGEFSRRAVWRAIGLPNLSPKNFKVLSLDSKSAFRDGFVCFLSNNVSRTLSFNCLSKFLLAKTRDEDSKDLQLGTFDSPQLFQPLNPTHSSSALLTSPYLKQPPPPFFATSLKK
jgi:hypothetical protein